MNEPSLQHVPSSYVPVRLKATSNGLGVAGFALSVLGVVSCGVLAPFGLLVSLAGMFKPPRGFAAAGLAISLGGCLILALSGPKLLRATSAWYTTSPMLHAAGEASEMVKGWREIEEYADENGVLPDDDTGTFIILEVSPNLMYRRLSAKKYEIRLAGPDEIPYNADDLVRRYDTSAAIVE
ncbi:MAG: hypothetical protein QGG36_05210 [Pirellulaceae bacterium]|nr:hypothetical protein [Pirellulaceae bacterium]